MKTLISVIFLMVSACAFAVAEPVSQTGPDGTAIGGKDAFAYHELSRKPQAAAVDGTNTWIVEFQGVKWRFASQRSSELFAADPTRYAPSYNGHCANALSLGEGLIPTDGTHWEIFGNSLYLFYAGRGRTRWLNGDWNQYKKEADAAWAGLSK